MSEPATDTDAAKNGRPLPPDVTLTSGPKTEDKGTQTEDKELPFDDYKVFNDPVHGHVALHPLLVKIIDTPQFQRLRNIKQLGGNYFVYPGASHNRFEHSIGVAYLAEKLVRMLQQRQKELNITKKDILCVAIAGLCHDLGHGPFSHLFDGMFLPQVLPDRKWKHEDGSCKMLDHLIEENGLKQEFEKHCLTDDDVIFIKEMIAGPQSGENDAKEDGAPTGGEWRYKGRDFTKSFLYEIVSNERNKMDVDKWDYFARDCHHLGIRNSFDHNRFMQFMKVLKSEDGQLQLCARDKELVNLYEMFHTRSILHQRAYQHKTSIAIELMITKALVKANKHIRTPGTGRKPRCISECIDDLVAYTKLNDSIFYRILFSELDNSDMDEARQLLDRVHRRNLFVCIGAVSCREKVTPVTEDDIISLDNILENGDIIVRKTKIDHGKGEDNPVKNFSFFRKSDKDQAYLIPETEIPEILLPQQFQDKSCLVWCTSEESEKIAAAKSCWKKWKGEHPEITELDITWTPMRKIIVNEPRGKRADSAENSNAKRKLFG